MSDRERPFIGSCGFCGDGLLRFVQCETCDEVVALCDECELMWSDIPGLADDANLSSDSSFPRCPHCGDKEAEFQWLTGEEVKLHSLEAFAEGDSV